MKKTSLEAIEQAVSVLGLVLYSGAILTLFVTGGLSEGDLKESSVTDFVLIRQIFLIFYIVTFGLLAYRWQLILYTIQKNILLILFTGLALLSINWSTSPTLTNTRAVALLGTNLFGLYLASRYTLKQQVMLLVQAFSIIILLSMLLIVLAPKYGIMGGYHTGAWRGVFNHKNGLGKWMALGAIAFFVQSIGESRRQIPIYIGLMFSILLVVMSRSSSAIGNLLIVAMAFLVLTTWRWRIELMIPVTIALSILTIGFWLWFNQNAALAYGVFGKDSDLSGRSELWTAVGEMAWRRPLQGYGYGAFWENRFGASSEVWLSIGWEAPNAHNGFLDLFLGLGAIGLVILALSFMSTLWRSLIAFRVGKTAYEYWPLLFMVYFVTANLTESGLMLQNDIFTVMYVSTAYSIVISTNSKDRKVVYGDA